MEKKPWFTLQNVIVVVAVAMALFQLYAGLFGAFEALRQRAIHLTFALVLAFLVHPAGRRNGQKVLAPVDWALIAACIVSGGYIIVNFYYVAFERIYYITPLLPIEKVLGVAALVVLLEAGRRVLGSTMPIIATGFLAYTFLGPYMPGILKHPGFDLQRLLDVQYLTTEGIYGIPVGISATYIVLFVLFGTVLQQTGFGEFIVDFAMGIAGRSRGGPAKVAVISSAAFGTISGSGTANALTTGTFTIPMMKKLGYKPHFAGAVEAAASTGGQIMPPVMGAAAFIMSQFTGIPYILIIKHAILPAVLYFLGIFFMVDLEAAKTGMRGLSTEELPNWKLKLPMYIHMVLPIVLLLYLMTVGYTPMFSVTWSIIAILVISFLRRATWLTPRKLINALYSGARESVTVALACGLAGVIIGVVSLTGIGTRFTGLLLVISGGNLFVALALTMVGALILGMGLPTSAAYVLQVALLVPALIKLGLTPLQANMFAFYFACISLITPPVAITAYAAAGLAGADMSKTGWTAARLAASAYIVPFMFAYAPALLLVGAPGELILAIISSVVGVYALSVGLEGFWYRQTSVIERLMAVGAAFLLIFPGLTTDLMGAALVVGLFLLQRYTGFRKLPGVGSFEQRNV